jgi:hypothetical protein
MYGIPHSFWPQSDQEPGSSVSIVFGYGLDDQAIEVQSLAAAKGFFPLAPGSRLALDTGGPFPGAKVWLGCDTDCLPPSIAEVKNEKELYLLSPKRFHGM